MNAHRTARRRNQRGVSLIIVLFLVVMLVLVAAGVLSNSSYSANDALNVQTKNETFNAAEAGLNVAVWNLDQNLSATSSGSNTIDGYTYTWSIWSNNLSGGASTTVSDPDPNQSSSIAIPAGQALLVGSASAITGGRTVYVEEMVGLAPPVYLGGGAITCGKKGIINHQQITDLSGNHAADIRCGTIVSSGGGQIPDGKSYATGSINTITGYDGQRYINQAPPTFLTAAELATIQASVLSQAQSGGSNYYTAGNVASGTIGTSAGKCVAYIGGNITVKGSSTLINYCETTVVMGDVTVSGNASYQALPASSTHIVYVFGNGGTTLQGTPTNAGIFYVANADVTLNGSGAGNFTGAIITPNNVTMNGGGTATFYYNSTQTPPPFIPNTVAPLSQWDY
jgi:hypothetical protein